MIFKLAHWGLCLACAIALIEYIGGGGELIYLSGAIIAFAGSVLFLWADGKLRELGRVPMPDFNCPDCNDPPRCGSAMRCARWK